LFAYSDLPYLLTAIISIAVSGEVKMAEDLFAIDQMSLESSFDFTNIYETQLHHLKSLEYDPISDMNGYTCLE
jgi:hypothetical protein